MGIFLFRHFGFWARNCLLAFGKSVFGNLMKTMGRDLIRRMKENEKCMRGSDNALDYQEIIDFCKSIQKCLRANYWLWNSYFSRRKCSHLVLPFWYHPRNDFARLSTNQIRRTHFFWSIQFCSIDIWVLWNDLNIRLLIELYTIICIVSSELMKSEVK